MGGVAEGTGMIRQRGKHPRGYVAAGGDAGDSGTDARVGLCATQSGTVELRLRARGLLGLLPESGGELPGIDPALSARRGGGMCLRMAIEEAIHQQQGLRDQEAIGARSGVL